MKVKIGREGVLEQNTKQVLFQNNKNELVEKNDVYWNKGSAENEFDVKVQLERGSQQGIQATIQEDAQPLDNKIFVSLDSTENPNVTILGRKSLEQGVENLPAANWILRAIESTGMSVQEADTETISIRPPTLSDTVILTRPDLVDQAGWSWLQNYAKNGGTLIIRPFRWVIKHVVIKSTVIKHAKCRFIQFVRFNKARSVVFYSLEQVRIERAFIFEFLCHLIPSI